jgi:radical SAM superfamily enzyme YgiQ (UPF0313 family)
MVEYMGLMCISAVLKEAGHTVEVFIDDETNERRFKAQLKSFNPDIVGFSVLSPGLTWSLRVGKWVKGTLETITVYGGYHPMMNPDMIERPEVDIVCLGEGEFPMRELADCIDQDRSFSHIEGLWVKTDDGIVRNEMRKELVDLETLPFHDRGIYDKYFFFRHSKYLRVTNGRGCPFRCAYCLNAALMDHYGRGMYVRKMRPERAIREIEYYVKQRGASYVYFIDEVLWIENAWLREFLTLYKERIGLPFIANFRLGPIEEEDIKLLADAGATILAVAAETGNETVRRELLRKNVTNEQIFKITGLLRKHNIRHVSTAFFGLPGGTVEEHVKQLDFYRKVKPRYLWTTFFTPFPGLQLTQEKAVKDLMPEDKDFALTFHHDMYLDLPDKDRLVNLKKIYFLLMLWPRATPFLVWLTRFRIPILFDVMFLCHFSWHSAASEGLSFLQLLQHMKTFIVNPLLKKVHLLRA